MTAGPAETVAFLSRPDAYPPPAATVTRRETHMSWVFFVDGAVYKLKKPVRFPYLDFSTLLRRERACRAEASLNTALAPGVYGGVVAVTAGPDGALRLGGAGEVVDWLVRMRRLDERQMLDARLPSSPPSRGEVAALADTLARFYRRTRRRPRDPRRERQAWREALDEDLAVLLRPELGLPAGLVRAIDRAMRRFLRQSDGDLGERIRRRRIVDAHGDLRPEHIWLGGRVKIIDRLEFNAALRALDPVDELAFLDLECER
ncbi:MAG TPA: hypothetical protein VG939_05695, partial [Caulobacteraceae bacterium]|nr:hypothetical protein [Caulobacteraceae bacterium]